MQIHTKMGIINLNHFKDFPCTRCKGIIIVPKRYKAHVTRLAITNPVYCSECEQRIRQKSEGVS